MNKFYVVMVLAAIFIIFGSIFIYRLSNKIEAQIRNWFDEHEKLKACIKSIKKILYKILITIFWLWVTISVGAAILDGAYKYYLNYKSPHQKRLEFLESNCWQIDVGYEILNNGKSTYKCPNGKEYQE